MHRTSPLAIAAALISLASLAACFILPPVFHPWLAIVGVVAAASAAHTEGRRAGLRTALGILREESITGD